MAEFESGQVPLIPELEPDLSLQDPHLLMGLDDLPMDILSSELTDDLDLDELFGVFDDSTDVHAPAEGGLTSPQRSNMVTPSTSESGNEIMHGRCASSDKEGVSNLSDKDRAEEEEKRMARMKRNRENAHLSRLRKKQQLQNLQQSCQNLKHQNTQLNLFIQRLAAENCLLRHHLNNVCKTSKVSVPEVPSVLAPQQGTQIATSNQNELKGKNDTSQGSENGSGESYFHPDPALKSSDCKPAETRQAKRKKIGGAGAAFLTLFSIFLFAGPMTRVNEKTESSMSVRFLPEGHQQLTLNHGQSMGRSLMMVEKQEDVDLSHYFSETVDALLEDQETLELPKHALASLENIAPHALALDKEGSRIGAEKPMPASTVFPALAERLFEASGLAAPQMCKKVFEFRSDDIPNRIRSKKNIEKYITGTYGFKGRSSGLQIHAEEPQSDSKESLTVIDIPQEDVEGSDASKDILPAQVAEPLLVSVLLPANSSGPSKSRMTAFEQLYVVILNPENTFSTYACDLPGRFLGRFDE